MDGYAHTATGSIGDVIEYQILSALPSITSRATSFSEYTYTDTLSAGLSYRKMTFASSGSATDPAPKKAAWRFGRSKTENLPFLTALWAMNPSCASK